MADELYNLLVRDQLEMQSHKTAYVLYLDMLGFSALTKAHPGTFSVEVNEDTVTTEQTPSATRFFNFQGGDEPPGDEFLDEVVDFLAVRDAGERGVLPADEHA